MAIERKPNPSPETQLAMDQIRSGQNGYLIPDDVAELAARLPVIPGRITLYAGRLAAEHPDYRQIPLEPKTE
jgi:hypothetical protein